MLWVDFRQIMFALIAQTLSRIRLNCTLCFHGWKKENHPDLDIFKLTPRNNINFPVNKKDVFVNSPHLLFNQCCIHQGVSAWYRTCCLVNTNFKTCKTSSVAGVFVADNIIFKVSYRFFFFHGYLCEHSR